MKGGAETRRSSGDFRARATTRGELPLAYQPPDEPDLGPDLEPDLDPEFDDWDEHEPFPDADPFDGDDFLDEPEPDPGDFLFDPRRPADE